MPAPGSSSGKRVRAAVADYLTAADIPNLSELYPAPPFDTSDIPWGTVLPVGVATNAIGVVYLDTDEDTTVAYDGQGGRRVVTYEVAVELLLVDTSGAPSGAQDAQDDLIDAIKARLRTDPALGTDQADSGIIQAAISRLFVERGRPVRPGNGNGWAAWTGVHFQVQTYEYST